MVKTLDLQGLGGLSISSISATLCYATPTHCCRHSEDGKEHRRASSLQSVEMTALWRRRSK
jgi:hypothetical protein